MQANIAGHDFSTDPPPPEKSLLINNERIKKIAENLSKTCKLQGICIIPKENMLVTYQDRKLNYHNRYATTVTQRTLFIGIKL